MTNTKGKILAAALDIFSEKGYEETTVRMILEKAGVTTGSFYHFFASKEELFEEVIRHYLLDYSEHVEAICTNSAVTVPERINALFAELVERMRGYYSQLRGDKLHWTIQCALHEKTLSAIAPHIEMLVKDAVNSGFAVCRMHTDIHTASAILIKGTEAILHSAHEQSLSIESVKSNIMEYVSMLFEIKAMN